MTSRIDVVVPTRDRPAELRACLESLAAQSFEDFHVIVVDDGSRVPVADMLGATVVRNDVSVGPATSRNRGVEAGTAPAIVFLDDDSVAHPDLLARHHAVLTAGDDPVACIGPLLAPTRRRLAPWNAWEADRLGREYRLLETGQKDAAWGHVYSGNFGARREDLAAAGGYDPEFSRQEDIELGFRLAQLGCRFVFEPRAVVWHDTHRPLSSWLGIPAAAAVNDVRFDRLRPGSGRLAGVQEGLAHRRGLLRAARWMFRRPILNRLGVGLALGAGRGLYALHADRLALPAFSVVWDLEYTRALQDALRSRDP